MQKLSLDPGELTVSSFEATPQARAAALGGNTNDEVCYCLSLLAEDCFGPSAGCSNDTQTEA